MKKIFTLIIGIVFSFTVLYSQVAPPQAFSFKATIKDKYGLPVLLKKINLRITILQGDMNGFPVYSEYFKPTTDLYSQVDVQIGQGTVLSGNFLSIEWSANKYFLKIEVDINGGTNYQLLSVTQLLSVPYALFAGKTTNSFSGRYGDLTGAPILALVATSGEYNDLYGKPALFSGNYNDLTNKPSLFSGNYNDLSNKPTLFNGTWISLTGKPTFSAIALSGSWKDLINTPTTLAGYGITDAMSTSHPANGITATDITNWNTAFSWGNHAGLYRPIGYVPDWSEITNKPTFAIVATSGSYTDLTNKPTIDGSETKVTAGTNITVTGAGTTASPYVINSTGGGSVSVHYIGENYGGGIVFYVYDNGQHGLIAATADQSTGIRWDAGTYTNTMAFADGVGAGKANTAIIIANQGYGYGATYAARICNEYSVTIDGVTYADWYLPSKYELNLLYPQKAVVGGFGSYWSSSEYVDSGAWVQSFIQGNQFVQFKFNTYYVRAVRSF
ncbi:MAG: DUF1566 domain-containing protein [Bacteroidales bacterium]